MEAKIGLKEISRSPDKLNLGHLNINLLRNKSDYLKNTIDRNIDNFLISETKLDDSFPTAQFKSMGSVLRLDLIEIVKGVGLVKASNVCT